jgi:carbamoylphosphate synthase large subunit
MDKSHQKEVAKSVGFDVADARVLEINNGVYSIPSNIKYPCYTKPLATVNGGKCGMRRCNNNNELAAALDDFILHRNQTGKILVEDYKKINKEYALLGFSDGENVFIPGILQLLTISQQYKGIALQGRVTSISGFEDVVEKFRQLVVKIGFVGLFDIDFYESDGKMYFCELNLRFGGSGYAITKMGCNLPAMMVEYFAGGDIDVWKKPVMGEAVYTNERMCFVDWMSGFITLDEYQRYMKTADILFIQDNDDPQPWKAYQKAFFLQRLLKAVKKLSVKIRFKHVPGKGCVKRFGI